MAITDRRGTITEESAQPGFTERRHGVTEGQAVKSACLVATTGNVTLAGLQTIDGVAVTENDRVLVRAQTTGTENGIYVANTGDWSRALDFDGARDVVFGTRVMVVSGTAYSLSDWYVSNSDPITIGTTAITFVDFLDIGGTIQAWDADLDALAALSSTGFAVRTASNTWAQRTITGTANEITLTNGSGVSGNPVVSLPSALTFTGKTITGGTFSGPSIKSITLQDSSDATKQLQFDLSGISTGTTRTLTVPDISSTIAVIGLAQTFTAEQTTTINQDAITHWNLINNSTGTSAGASFSASNGADACTFGLGGVNRAGLQQNRGFINVSSGLSGFVLQCVGAAPIVFATSAAEVARIQSGLMVGTTTDPGAGVVNVLTGYRIGNAATSGNVLRGDGTNFISATLAGSDITGAALTKSDDTNVTLTLGGTPTTALLRAASITAGWTGTLAASRGGFGADVSASSGVPLFATGTPTFTGTSGSGNFVRVTSATLVTPVLGVAAGTSLALGGATIGSNALAVTGTSLLTGDTTISSAALILSGNISSAAWTTNGLRLKAQAATLTDTSSSGTVVTAYTHLWDGSTIAASSSTTFTQYYNAFFKQPTAGTNVTLTNAWALGAENLRIGNSTTRFTVDVSGNVALPSAATLTYGGVTLSAAVTGTGNMVLSASPTLSGTVGGALTFSGALTLSSALTYGGVTLSNAVTGTGNMVLSASPTLSGTVGGALTFSGAHTLSSALTYGGVTLSNSVTGTGSMVLATSPTLVTPVLGVATATSINKMAITTPATSSTLAVADGKTFTVSNTLTLTGTDTSSVAFGAGGTVAYVANKLSVFAATSSSELAGVISDETGSGALVFAVSPALTGTPTAPTAAGGTNTTQIASTAFVTAAVAASTAGVASFVGRTGTVIADAGDYAAIFPNYLTGLILSYASTTTFTVGVGAANNSTNVYTMALGSAITKSTSAWAVGSTNGGLDTGSIASSTWYHVYLIRRSDTGVVDVLFSTSASAPTMPTSYDQKRRIGSVKTNGSSQFVKWVQNNDQFMWDVMTADVTATNPGTSAVTRTLTVPTGIQVRALFLVMWAAAAQTDMPGAVYISDLSLTDSAPTTVSPASLVGYTSSGFIDNGGSFAQCITNTSAQVRSRVQISGAGTVLRIATFGWLDSRGRDG